MHDDARYEPHHAHDHAPRSPGHEGARDDGHDHDHGADAPFVRRCDVAVVGGSAAGLAAALTLARSRRSVIVIDDGSPRNAPAAHLHGYLGHEGRPPSELLADARAEVRSYGVEILRGRVMGAEVGADGRIRVSAGDIELRVRRLVVATGVIDELPEIAGLADEWGHRVLHCPYCHGWEVRDRPITVVATNAVALRQAGLFRQLTPDVTVVLHDGVDADGPDLDALRAAGVRVVDDRVASVDRDGDDLAVRLAGGSDVRAAAIVVAPRYRARVDALGALGLALDEHPTGLGVAVGADATGATSVRGVFAAGNVRSPWFQVAHAAADGSFVGAQVNHDLVQDNLRNGTFTTTSRVGEWDEMYEGDAPRWSGNPNGTLVEEIAGLAPGRAIDIGCGEGADAVWLAERGWTVTAVDVARRAVERGTAAAAERGVTIDWRVGGLDSATVPAAAFDLVSLQYPAVPRTPEGEAIEALLAAVAPGGTLLVVGHAFDDEGTHERVDDHVQPFDPAAYLQPADVASRLDEHWSVEVDEVRSRPGGHSTAHHRDVVLRATRRS